MAVVFHLSTHAHTGPAASSPLSTLSPSGDPFKPFLPALLAKVSLQLPYSALTAPSHSLSDYWPSSNDAAQNKFQPQDLGRGCSLCLRHFLLNICM